MSRLLPLILFCASVVETSAAAPRDCVILIHGLGRTPFSMAGLEWFFHEAGYQVINLRYPSRRDTVERLAEDYLQPVIAAQSRSGMGQIHFVTHSLGGILVRQYLATHTMTNLGRVVMLAPPNHGSKTVDRLKKTAVGRWILGPAGCELGTGSAELPERLGPPQFPVGILAARSDGKVSVPSAQLEGAADFRVVSGWHTWIMWQPKTAREILAFLKNGHFLRCGRPRFDSFNFS